MLSGMKAPIVLYYPEILTVGHPSGGLMMKILLKALC